MSPLTPEELPQEAAAECASLRSQLAELRADVARLEAALQAAQSRDSTLRRLMAANILGVVLLDSEGVVVESNALFQHLCGRSAEELAANTISWRELVAEPDRPSLDRALEQLRQTATTLPWEMHLLRPDGTLIPVQSGATLLPRPHLGPEPFVLAFAADLSETRRVQSEIAAAEARMRAIVENLHDGLLITDLDERILYANRRMAEMTGYSLAEMVGNRASDLLLPPEERPTMLARIRERVRGQSDQYELTIRTKDGGRWLALVNGSPLHDANGQIVGTIGAHTNISAGREAEVELRRSAAALRESEERYALAARGANDGLWDWNLQTGVIYFSPRWRTMVGLAPEADETSPLDWFSRVHEEDLERLKAALAVHLLGESPHFECEYRLRHEDKGYLWMLGRALAVRDSSGQAYRIAGSQTDITTRKRFEEQLSRNAFYDPLTGLPNRALFLDRVDRAISRVHRHPALLFAVLFVDLDRFKKVNDSLGHVQGDELLKQAAERLSGCLRPGDTASRVAGDEFAVLLDDLSDHSQATWIAERIQHEIARPFTLPSGDVFLSVSIGIAFSGGAEDEPEVLMRNADTAMYRAKAQGRARHEVFESAMHQRAVRLLELETGLWRALEREELRLHYQPIFDLASGRLAGFEALVRWQHPQKGLVSPVDFITTAEETGLIVPIGWWVLGEASRQLAQWNQDWAAGRGLFMAVNLSSKQLQQPNMVNDVARIVTGNGVNPGQIKLEITESVLVTNPDAAVEQLSGLKQLGIQLALDDFGTGYSSLSYLHRFPLDTLKIDRSFVSNMDEDCGESGTNSQIVATILRLADGMGLAAVAEGVETREHLEILRSMNCRYAQGFYFSRPLPPEEIISKISRHPQW